MRCRPVARIPRELRDNRQRQPTRLRGLNRARNRGCDIVGDITAVLAGQAVDLRLYPRAAVRVSADRATASFMRSYPNYIPLGPNGVRRIAGAVQPFAFERVYGAWWDRSIMANGKAAVDRSVERALRWLAD